VRPHVFIGKVKTADGYFILTTDPSRITCDRDVYIKPEEFVYLATIKDDDYLEWHFYDLNFCAKIEHAKFRKVWRMKPFENLANCECNQEAIDCLTNNGYKLPDDIKVLT
jgi:hypothetical protein